MTQNPLPIKHLLAPPDVVSATTLGATGTLVHLPKSCAVQAWLQVPPSHEKHRVDLLSLSNARQARPQAETLSRTGYSDVKGFSVPAYLLPSSIPAVRQSRLVGCVGASHLVERAVDPAEKHPARPLHVSTRMLAVTASLDRGSLVCNMGVTRVSVRALWPRLVFASDSTRSSHATPAVLAFVEAVLEGCTLLLRRSAPGLLNCPPY
jgi:hypothetical protein